MKPKSGISIMKMMRNLESVLQREGVIFLTYGGFLTQSLLVSLTEALERGVEGDAINKKTSINIFTVFIEVAQNIMNYSALRNDGTNGVFDTRGMIVVGKDTDDKYYVLSQNIIAPGDKEKLEPKLIEVINSDKETIKKLYREARRDGRNTHSKGGGIGLYEIAKKCDEIEYAFEESDQLESGHTLYKFKAIITS